MKPRSQPGPLTGFSLLRVAAQALPQVGCQPRGLPVHSSPHSAVLSAWLTCRSPVNCSFTPVCFLPFIRLCKFSLFFKNHINYPISHLFFDFCFVLFLTNWSKVITSFSKSLKHPTACVFYLAISPVSGSSLFFIQTAVYFTLLFVIKLFYAIFNVIVCSVWASATFVFLVSECLLPNGYTIRILELVLLYRPVYSQSPWKP